MIAEAKLVGPACPLNLATWDQSGPPLLFIHGVGRRWQDFVPFANDLSCDNRILLLDLRGHGQSGRTPGHYRAVDYVDDVLRVLDEIGAPTVIYGHSLGALLAGAAAAACPERVTGIVLEDPPGPRLLDRLPQTTYQPLFQAMQRLAGSDQSAEFVATLLADVRLPLSNGRVVRFGDVRDRDSIRFSAECLLHVDPEVYSPVLAKRWLDGFDSEAVWRAVRCPAQLLQADEACGSMQTELDAEDIGRWLVNGQTVRFPGIGHLIHWTASERTRQLLNQFLKSLES